MLQGVLARDIDSIWPIASKILQRAVDKSQFDYSTHDIYAALKEKDMQLWVWLEDNEITSCLVTQIVSFPRRRICQLPYIAGKGMKDWLACESIITAWAKERNCTQLEGFCRKGWLRKLPHWRIVWTTLRKDI